MGGKISKLPWMDGKLVSGKMAPPSLAGPAQPGKLAGVALAGLAQPWLPWLAWPCPGLDHVLAGVPPRWLNFVAP